ncbi:MAG: HAD hydrolase-like protein, partial [Clostridia bacterium]|nr:HAD hydrolase-like protein [Clostridia bacterium]
VLLIGDRKYDTEGAHKVGIACFGVYMDCAEEGEHEQAGADYIAHGVKELTEALLK